MIGIDSISEAMQLTKSQSFFISSSGKYLHSLTVAIQLSIGYSEELVVSMIITTNQHQVD